MKRLVICCDGTWNRLDAVCPTNVAKLAQMILPHAQDGTLQLTWHLDGVGSGGGTGRVAQTLDRLLGGMFGHGLLDRIAEAYRFLVFNYAPGDEIYIFGYSRGAYMARSLGGLIRNCGILEREHASKLPRAIELYRAKGPDRVPDGQVSREFRARLSAHTATSSDETEWRRARGLQGEGAEPVALGVHYLGVWDTVGALGVPDYLLIAGRLNRRHQFHDTRLSSSVRAARHAVAIDERRATFPPTLWENLATLNDGRPEKPYREEWFPGDHGSVGGGGDVTALSNAALLWVLEGARQAGVAFDPQQVDGIAGSCDALGPLSCVSQPRKGVFGRLMRLRQVDRRGPDNTDCVSEAALLRWSKDPHYRPLPLRRVLGD